MPLCMELTSFIPVLVLELTLLAQELLLGPEPTLYTVYIKLGTNAKAEQFSILLSDNPLRFQKKS